MAPPKSKKHSFDSSSADEQKVYDMVMGYLEVQAERANVGVSDPEDEEEGAEKQFDLRPILKKLSLMEAVNFCKESDFKLKRSKSAAVAKMAEKAFSRIRSEQEVLWAKADVDGADLDSDFEGLDMDNMMEVKDMNQQNKSVVSLWNIQPAQVNTPSGTATPNTPNASSSTTTTATTEKTEESKKVSKKRERSSKDKESSSKRQKGTLVNFLFCEYF